MTLYGRNPGDEAEVFHSIRDAALTYGQKPVADATGLARGSVKRICEGKPVRTGIPRQAIVDGVVRLSLSARPRPGKRRS
jgi:hypothetical protein